MKTKNTLFSVILLITFCIPQIGNTQTSTISSEVYLDLETGDTYVDDFAKGIQVESRFDLRLTWYNNVIVWIPNWNATNLSAAYVLDTSYSEISYNTIDSQTFCTNYGCDNEYLDPLSPNNGIGVSLIINTNEGNYYKIKYQNFDSENYTVTLNYEVMEEITLPDPFSFNTVNNTGIESELNTASGDRSIAMGSESEATKFAAIAAGYQAKAQGDVSVALGNGAQATGTFAVSMGHFSKANGDNSVALGFFNTAYANHATAMGANAEAYGIASTAMGRDNDAVGENSVAMGYTSTSQGYASLATGRVTNAVGNHSVSMGQGTVAQAFNSLAMGQYNTVDTNNNGTTYNGSNSAFIIGNGADNNNRSDAFHVLFNGTTTIAGNVTAPAFIGDGSQLTNLPASTVNYSNLEDKPFSYGTDENNPGIQATSTTASGARAFAVGSGTQASGSNAFASGDRTKATNSYTTAMGYKSEASNFASTALGKETIASGQYATAMGQQTTASQNASTAMGDGSIASGNVATAMGVATISSGEGSTSIGGYTTAGGVYSFASGDSSKALGNYSSALGIHTNANGWGTTAIGVYNKINENNINYDFSLNNTAFVIGNGWLNENDEIVRSNAFEVLFDGTTTIAGDLNINSDARLKANIISLGATLSKLLQIDGKTYTMKKDANHKMKIGLLAQDIEKIFPELVSETNNIKSVNYQGLVPVLINAIKEQQHEIERLKKQEERLRLLEQKVNTLLDK